MVRGSAWSLQWRRWQQNHKQFQTLYQNIRQNFTSSFVLELEQISFLSLSALSAAHNAIINMHPTEWLSSSSSSLLSVLYSVLLYSSVLLYGTFLDMQNKQPLHTSSTATLSLNTLWFTHTCSPSHILWTSYSNIFHGPAPSLWEFGHIPVASFPGSFGGARGEPGNEDNYQVHAGNKTSRSSPEGTCKIRLMLLRALL